MVSAGSGKREQKPKEDYWPAEPDAELAVLYSMMQSRDAADEASMILVADDFFDPVNRATFAAMQTLRDQNQPIDPLTLAMQLKADRQWSEGDGEDGKATPRSIGYLFKIGATPGNSLYYAERVRKASSLRQIRKAGEAAMNAASGLNADPDEVLGSLESTLTDIATNRIDKRSSVVDLGQAFEAALDRVNQRITNGRGEGINAGYAKLDEMTGGFRAGELCIIAARTSQGKSVLAQNISENIALREGKRVLLVSLEMSSAEIAERILASQGRVPLWRMRNGSLYPEHRESIVKAAADLNRAPLTIDDSPSRSVSEIASLARQQKRKHALDLLVVDYVTQIRPDNPRDPREQQVAKIVRRLKVLARELKIPILALAQVNRAPEQGSKPRAPRLSDLRESGSLEQDADMVWFIHWPEGDPKTAEEAEIHVAKQRNGPTGVVKLSWLRDFVRFDDRPQDKWEEQRQNWKPKPEREYNEFDHWNDR